MEIIPFCIQDDTDAARQKRAGVLSLYSEELMTKPTKGVLECEME
jgi:hypothetical protein